MIKNVCEKQTFFISHLFKRGYMRYNIQLELN